MKKILVWSGMVILLWGCSNTSNNNATPDSSVNRDNSLKLDTGNSNKAIPTNSDTREPDTSTHVRAVQGNNGANTTNGVNGSRNIQSGSSRKGGRE